MFLNELNKKEANAFISLIENLSMVDDIYAECEKVLVDSYIKELSLLAENRETLSFEAAINEFNDSSSRIKNIVYFELVGVALVDGAYEDRELEFLNNLAANFNISKKKQIKYVEFFRKVKNTFDNTVVDAEAKIQELETAVKNLLEED
jgi:hypothetical protein